MFPVLNAESSTDNVFEWFSLINQMTDMNTSLSYNDG